ncbi:hypothetical protein [Streptomyces acidicola]|uniref:Uncharacterized protein n=1 Tax=Streptomyces acidicola TaxID=2596892 RepID=A0A5N8WKX1_9ACTN|nr:hypothetical protein [Streptomyces acidicola]MPY48113.1 hypothetical protein [Streptomyces acidicola]
MGLGDLGVLDSGDLFQFGCQGVDVRPEGRELGRVPLPEATSRETGTAAILSGRITARSERWT